MGGLFSTVRDLAGWVDGFARAFAPRGEDAHPLSRASRLEMQQVHRTIDPELTWTSVAQLPTVVATGYGFGTFIRSDMELGTVVAHSGGYPGFGSHMRWHPASGVGVVVLGNRTYFPALKIGDQILRASVRAEAAPIRRMTPAPALEVARDAVERLLAAWDDGLAAATFSMNVEMDEPLERRRAAFDRLRETHGPLHRSDEPATSDTPLHAEMVARRCIGTRTHPGGDDDASSGGAEAPARGVDVGSRARPRSARRGGSTCVGGQRRSARHAPARETPPTAAHRARPVPGERAVRPGDARPRYGRPASTSATFRARAERGALGLPLTVDDGGHILTATWIPARSGRRSPTCADRGRGVSSAPR